MCAQCLWYEGWVDTDASHVFPQVVLAVITLRRGCVGGSKAYVGCEMGLLLCSVAVATLSAGRCDPQSLEQPCGSGLTRLCSP